MIPRKIHLTISENVTDELVRFLKGPGPGPFRFEDGKTGAEVYLKVMPGLALTAIPDRLWNIHVWKGIGVPRRGRGDIITMDGREADVYIQSEHGTVMFADFLSAEKRDALREGYYVHLTGTDAEKIADAFRFR